MLFQQFLELLGGDAFFVGRAAFSHLGNCFFFLGLCRVWRRS